MNQKNAFTNFKFEIELNKTKIKFLGNNEMR